MIDVNQIILISSVMIITILLTIVGIQAAFVLREFRQTLMKMNKILTDTGSLTGSMSRSVQELNGFAAGLKTALNVFRRFKPSAREKSDE